MYELPAPARCARDCRPRRPRAHALRGPRRASWSSSAGARTRGARAWPGGGGRRARPGWGSRASSTSSCTRIARRAGSSSRAASVSYGKATAVPPDDRSAQVYFRDRRRATTPRDPREGHGQAPRRWTSARADAARPPGAARRARGGRRCGASIRRSVAQRRWTRSSALASEGQLQPLLLVFEDLHWIDSETQASSTAWSRACPRPPVLLAVNYRPEYEHGWGGKTYYRQLRIDPLPPESAGELLHALARRRRPASSRSAAAHRAHRREPFFLEESVRTLVGDRRADRRARRLPARPGAPTRSRCRRPSRPSWPPASTDLPPRRSTCSRRRRSVGKDVPLALSRGSRRPPRGRAPPRISPACRPPSSCTRRASSPSSSTPSSTPSPTRWRTGACSASGGASFTRASRARWSALRRSARRAGRAAGPSRAPRRAAG